MQNFLDTSSESNIPEGGGGFPPLGLIAPWKAAVLYRFWSGSKLPEDILEAVQCYEAETNAGSFFYYFPDYDDATQAAKEVDAYNPDPFWRFEAQHGSVIWPNDEFAGKFTSNVVAFETRVKTYRSAKYRHEFHLLALPSAVNAMAKLNGYIPQDDTTWNLDELNQNPDDMEFNDDFQFQLIGNPDAEEGDDDHYMNSILWKRRAALWRKLGEENPQAFQLKNKGKYATTSDKLSECLGVAHYTWKSPAWLRLVSILDPRVDALINDKRARIPVIYEIFGSEEDARVAAQADADRMAGDDEVTQENVPANTNDSGSLPPVPQMYADIGMDEASFAEMFEEAMGSSGTMIEVAKVLELGVPDAKRWYDALS